MARSSSPFWFPSLLVVGWCTLYLPCSSSFVNVGDAAVTATAASFTQHHNIFLTPITDPQQILTDITTTLLTSSSSSSSLLVSPEPIHTAFTVATFFPQPFWLLMILLPNNVLTKKIMAGLEIPLLCCLLHFFIVTASLVLGGSQATAPLAEFNQVFDINGDPQRAFMGMTSSYPNFVAEEWSHVLTWDLFVGRYIWLDGLRRGISTAPAVLFCNLIGPPGLLIHWLTCTLSGKPIVDRDNVLDSIRSIEQEE